MGANDKVAATFHGRSRLEELKACAEMTSAFPESEAEDVLARGVLDLLDALNDVRGLFEDAPLDYAKGVAQHVRETIRKTIDQSLGES